MNMHLFLRVSTGLLVGSLAVSSLYAQQTTPVSLPVKTDTTMVLATWPGPYGGLPPFDQVKVSYFKPALEVAMAEKLKEVEQVAANTAAPTFDNTIAALERTGRMLDRVSTIYYIWSSNRSDSVFEKVEQEMEPRLSALYDKIYQNTPLFRRIETVYNAPEKAKLTPEQQRLVWVYYTDFVRSGAKLDTASKAVLTGINQQLATLFTQFSQNVLADERELYIELKSEGDLEGLPPSIRDAAAAAATARNKPGVWLITNTRSSVDPFLTYSSRRDLREQVWRMFKSRGDNANEHNNNAIISQILQLRAQRARLIGYPSHAHMQLTIKMAKTPERAMKLMNDVWKPAVARVRQEVADMQALAKKEGSNITIEPWDYLYYAEKVRKAKYDLDQNEIKPYLQLEKLREGMFWVAGELYGFQFTPVTNVPVFHPDVRVWQVTDKTTGKHVGLWYFDPYARQGKSSGAWQSTYRSQERLDSSVTPLVSNNSNFLQGKPGEPVLISWDDATTLFHEFGHAIHALCTNVTYPMLAGNIYRDYVEFPSQLLEHWLSTPEVLERFALHYQTGQPIPKALVQRIERTTTFNQGYETVEALSSALLDMKLHLAGEQKIDPATFEKTTLAELGMPKEIAMRHRLPQFGHIFSSDSYSAGYYGYLWSDVLTADAYTAFTEAGGPYDKAVANRLREHVLSKGNSVEPEEGYRAFRGRDPKVEALMKKRGFTGSTSVKDNKPTAPKGKKATMK